MECKNALYFHLSHQHLSHKDEINKQQLKIVNSVFQSSLQGQNNGIYIYHNLSTQQLHSHLKVQQLQKYNISKHSLQ